MKSMRLILPLLSLCGLLSCPIPIDTEMLLNVKDVIAPEITLDCPAEGSCYASTVLVSGTVSDSSQTAGDNEGSVELIHYELMSSPLSGTAPVEEGSFTFVLAAQDLSGDQTLLLRATDWNGNSSEKYVTLLDGGNDIPSFAVDSDNHQVTLTWDPVPLAGGYSVYYTTNNSYPNLPEGNNGLEISNAESGTTLNGLQNGQMHIFRLHAHLPDVYQDSWSGFVQAVPLSSTTLAPRVRQDTLGGISLFWRDIPAGCSYELLRSESGMDSVYSILTGALTESRYLDRSVLEDRTYSYKVRPISGSGVESYPACGKMSTLSFTRNIYSFDTNVQYIYGVAVDVARDYAYLAEFTGRSFIVVDVSGKATPTEAGRLRFPDVPDIPRTDIYPMDVELSGDVAYADYAFVADYNVGLLVVDVSNPVNPELFRMVNPTWYARDCRIQGNYAYLPIWSADEGWLKVIDLVEVLDPGKHLSLESAASPAGPGEYTEISCRIADRGYGLAVTADRAYVAGSFSGLHVIDITNPPGVTDASLIDSCDTPGRAYAVDVDDRGYAYVADDDAGLQIVDVDPSRPATYLTIVGNYDTLGNARDVRVAGTQAFVADLSGDIPVIDISDPHNPMLVEVITVQGSAEDVFVDDGWAYAAAGEDGLQIFSSTDFTSREEFLTPVVSGFYDTEYLEGVFVYDLDIVDDRAYLATAGPDTADPQGLMIIDVNPDSGSYMSVLDYCPTPGAQTPQAYNWTYLHTHGFGVDVVGDFAFVADDEEGLQIIDINPAHSETYLSIVGALDTVSPAWDVEVHGDYAFVAAWSGGLQIIDISDPFHPLLIGIADTTGEARAVHIREDTAYVAGRTIDLEIFNISDPENPERLGHEIGLGSAWDVTTDGQYAYVASGERGGASELQIFDITDPGDPIPAGNLEIVDKGTLHSVEVVGDYVYGSTGYFGEYWGYLLAIDVSDPETPRIRGSYTKTDGSTLENVHFNRTLHVAGNRVYLGQAHYLLKEFSIERNDE